MKNFRTYQLAVRFYKECRTLPLKGSIKEQMKRASSSIALNLAEGSGRISRKDQRRFYLIALGSLRECQAVLHLEIEEDSPILHTADSLGASIYRLIQSRE